MVISICFRLFHGGIFTVFDSWNQSEPMKKVFLPSHFKTGFLISKLSKKNLIQRKIRLNRKTKFKHSFYIYIHRLQGTRQGINVLKS